VEGQTTKTRRADLLVVAVVWLIATVGLEIWAAGVSFHPFGGSVQAEIADEAFDTLIFLAVPVFTFVLTVLGYAVFRFRAKGDESDGPPVQMHRGFVYSWVAVSTVLSVLVIFNPGLKGLSELDEAAAHPDMTIEVTAEQWNWTYTYVEAGVTVESADELVLPNDTTVLFQITSTDVIHSFWIPAFRIKVDAVPGQFTETVATPTEVGDFAFDDGYRVQCAELCGTGHARMRTRVVVLEPDDFADWITAAGSMTGSG